mgnify:CR=1 FL=1
MYACADVVCVGGDGSCAGHPGPLLTVCCLLSTDFCCVVLLRRLRVKAHAVRSRWFPSHFFDTLLRGAPSGNLFPAQRRAGSIRPRSLLVADTDDLLWISNATRAAGADAELLLSRARPLCPAEARDDDALDAELARGPLLARPHAGLFHLPRRTGGASDQPRPSHCQRSRR